MADLIRDDTAGAFFTHPDLPPKTREMLRLQYLIYLHPPPVDSEWAAKFACSLVSGAPIRHYASDAASTLARLSASEVAGRLAVELNKPDKRNRENRYLRPSVWVGVWRDPPSRRKLQRFVREKLKLSDEEHQRFSAGIHTAVRDEPQMRAIQLAMLLIEQAELAARPLCPEEVDRLIKKERQRAENLRRAEFVESARLFEQLAADLAQDHEKDFRTEAERESAMIRAAAKRLIRDFCMRGDRLVAGLVGEALGCEISSRHVRHVATGR